MSGQLTRSPASEAEARCHLRVPGTAAAPLTAPLQPCNVSPLESVPHNGSQTLVPWPVSALLADSSLQIEGSLWEAEPKRRRAGGRGGGAHTPLRLLPFDTAEPGRPRGTFTLGGMKDGTVARVSLQCALIYALTWLQPS